MLDDLFTSISNSKNYQIIIDRIKDAIVDGSLTVGSRLPTELELAEQFQVSRSSVREALKALEVLGVVESHKGGGSFIVNNISRSMTDTMSIYFMLKGGSLRDLISMRVALELGALYAVIQNGTDGDIQLLEQALNQYVNAATTEERKLYDRNFHTVLISLAANPLYDLTLGALTFIFAKDVSYSHQVVEERG
jgi:GntR family transcriptional repressor for pyruvate dehydrogenase complex